jgi:hypothetical protein
MPRWNASPGRGSDNFLGSKFVDEQRRFDGSQNSPRDVCRPSKCEGNNGFTCMPGNPKVIGQPPMCADAAAMQWSADFETHKAKPTNTEPGIIYMLAGATQRSDTNPYDTTSPPIPIGPHWMIMWPFDPKSTGLPTTHKPTGAYIMWAGSPYAHVHVMGRP